MKIYRKCFSLSNPYYSLQQALSTEWRGLWLYLDEGNIRYTFDNPCWRGVAANRNHIKEQAQKSISDTKKHLVPNGATQPTNKVNNRITQQQTPNNATYV